MPAGDELSPRDGALGAIRSCGAGPDRVYPDDFSVANAITDRRHVRGQEQSPRPGLYAVRGCCARRVDRPKVGSAAMREREQDTRHRRIDPKLAASGWVIEEATSTTPAHLSMPTALTELPTHDGPADYALCADARVLGVVEAKKLTVGPQGVLTQAERYSRGIQQQPRYQGEYGVPFLYSTNGEKIRFHDVRREHNRSREVSAFHTPDALARDAPARLRRGARAAERGPQRTRGSGRTRSKRTTAIEQAIATASARCS